MDEVKFDLLEVDLTLGKSQVIDVTRDVKKYLGGRGLANKLIWDMVPTKVDPLGDENILHIGVGPLTGLIGSKTILSFLSPLTGWAGRSAVSGDFGDQIVRTQYNAGILIKGKANKPVYLYIYDDKVEIRDASDLWGMWTQKTEITLGDRLKEETGELFSILCIGPAGENLVRYANATTEFIHSANKWGCGAVMGSKKLKAIAVRGTKGPIYADHQKVWELFKNNAISSSTLTFQLDMNRWGAMTGIPGYLRHAAEGIKNNHLGYHPIAETSDPHAHDLKYHIWTVGCAGCAVACKIPFLKNCPRGVFAGEFRHDNNGGFNANIMVGFEEMTEISAITNELGLDAEEVGGLVAWAMDMYEHGIITKADLGGIDLKWGDTDAVCELLQKIAYKENFLSATLAEGFRRAYKTFGEESKWYAFEVHGCASPTYDVRNQGPILKRSPTVGGLANATSHNGARLGNGIDSGLTDSATFCIFASRPLLRIMGGMDPIALFYLNPVCGWNLNIDDVKNIALRNYYFNRCLSLREGYNPAKDDYLPPRAFDEPITDKYGQTWVWDKKEFEEEKKFYYQSILKLTETGIPPRGALERLGLDFVIPALSDFYSV